MRSLTPTLLLSLACVGYSAAQTQRTPARTQSPAQASAPAQILEGTFDFTGKQGHDDVNVEVQIHRDGATVRVKRSINPLKLAPNSVPETWAAEAVSVSDRRVGVYLKPTGGAGMSAALAETKRHKVYATYTLQPDGTVVEKQRNFYRSSLHPWVTTELTGTKRDTTPAPITIDSPLESELRTKASKSAIRVASLVMFYRKKIAKDYAPHNTGYARDTDFAFRYFDDATWSRAQPPAGYTAYMAFRARNSSDPGRIVNGKGTAYVLFDETGKLFRMVYRTQDNVIVDDRDVGYSLPN